MPLFLVATRIIKRVGRAREGALMALAGLIVVIGALLFSIFEHVSFGLAMYWAVTTATTVGYGDVTPHNTAGRVIAAGVMLTTIPIVGSVFALFAGASAVGRLGRLLGLDTRMPDDSYVVVYGSHPVLTRVLEDVVAGGEQVVLVAPERPAGVGDSVRLLAGNPASEEMVRRSEPARASRALIACTADADTLVIAVALHGLAPDLEIYALTQSASVAAALRELGVSLTLSSDDLVGHTLAKSLETPLAGDVLLQLVGNERYRLHELPVTDALVSEPLSRARALTGRIVLGIARGHKADLGIEDDPVLAAGDRLIVLEPVAPSTS